MAVLILVCCDEELASLCVEDSGDFSEFGVFALFYIVGCISGNYIQSVDGDDFCGVCEVHCFCEGYSYSQAGEAAGADGYINMLDFSWFSAEAVQQVVNSGEDLCTVPHWAGEIGLGEYLVCKCNCDRA